MCQQGRVLSWLATAAAHLLVRTGPFETVIVAGRLIDLATNFLHAPFDVAMLASTIDDGGIVLVDGDLLGLAEVADLYILQLDAQVIGDSIATGDGGDVLQHGRGGDRRIQEPLRQQRAAYHAAC